MGWTEEQARKARGLMEAFCGADEVAAAMDCRASELNALCRDAFGLSKSAALARFSAVGRARLRVTLMDEATSGNFRALDVLARSELGLGPVESRRKATPAKNEETTKPKSGDGKARAALKPVAFARTLKVVGE